MKLIVESLPVLLKGTLVTIELTLAGLTLGLVIAIPVSFFQVYGARVPRLVCSIYERTFRSIPLLVLLMLIFYGLPEVGIKLEPFFACVLGLGLRSSAYQSQIFRGAILSVGKGQSVAALSLGMTRFQVFRHIVFPQALRFSIVPWTNELTIVLKDSSMAYALGVVELLRQGSYIIARTYEPMLIFLLCAAIYLALTIFANRILGFVEKKLRIPGFETREVVH
ncbi:MAG: Polar amino acid ABC transporter, inner membrane subunit [Thermotoga sp. 50_1627]|nr:MAG: Polar amino acid ABC transporter, inner membrane subunit [Thermotoga sp. 50_64]KUK25480.1 MAG: Polar amino acid ABC transporter, inner membrane subunit [Thermotoga sp. 50_1627]MDK2922971.1 polar amino acid transport system permease protein [Pseudothermotoga sp.]